MKKRSDGTLYKRVVRWFGYRLHLVVDAEYELPVAYEVTRASKSELTETKKLVKRIKERHGRILENCRELTADKLFDDGKFISNLWDEHGVKPVIGIRNLWKDGEETKLVPGMRDVVYD